MNTVARKIRKRILAIDGVVESPGIFYDADAFWVNGTQIAHWRDENAMEVRLTRKMISAERPRLKADERVTLRTGSSDWLTVTFASARDAEFVAELIEIAAMAHRPAAGTALRPPPVGPDLERRRRFH